MQYCHNYLSHCCSQTYKYGRIFFLLSAWFQKYSSLYYKKYLPNQSLSLVSYEEESCKKFRLIPIKDRCKMFCTTRNDLRRENSGSFMAGNLKYFKFRTFLWVILWYEHISVRKVINVNSWFSSRRVVPLVIFNSVLKEYRMLA